MIVEIITAVACLATDSAVCVFILTNSSSQSLCFFLERRNPKASVFRCPTKRGCRWFCRSDRTPKPKKKVIGAGVASEGAEVDASRHIVFRPISQGITSDAGSQSSTPHPTHFGSCLAFCIARKVCQPVRSRRLRRLVMHMGAFSREKKLERQRNSKQGFTAVGASRSPTSSLRNDRRLILAKNKNWWTLVKKYGSDGSYRTTQCMKHHIYRGLFFF